MPGKKPKPETITITAALSPRLVRMIEELTPPGRTVAGSIEELLLLSVSHEHSLKCAAPRDIYRIPRPVSDEESAAVQAAAAPMIERLLAAHREEAVAWAFSRQALRCAPGFAARRAMSMRASTARPWPGISCNPSRRRPPRSGMPGKRTTRPRPDGSSNPGSPPAPGRYGGRPRP